MEEKKKTSKVAWAALVVVLVLVGLFILGSKGDPNHEWCTADPQTHMIGCFPTQSQCEGLRQESAWSFAVSCRQVRKDISRYCIRRDSCFLSYPACRSRAVRIGGVCEYITYTAASP